MQARKIREIEMNRRQRSLAGGLAALLLVPVIAGLLACLPVPIGDPERSRVDIPLEGVWVDDSYEAVWVIQAYDKRTWIVRAFGILDSNSSQENFRVEDDSYEELVQSMQEEGIGKAGYFPDTSQVYKVWRTKIAGEYFLTWRTIGGFDDEGLAEPEYWFVWRVAEIGENSFELAMVTAEFGAFKNVDRTRRDYERVIRKNVDDPDLYVEDTMRWIRVHDEHLEMFRELADEILAGPND